MVDCDLSRVLCILRSVYPVVLTIEEFSQSIVFKDGKKAVLIQPSDSNYIKTSARKVFICTDKLLHQRVASTQQISTLSELLAFVLNSAKKKNKSNVLCHGYALWEHEYREADQLRFQGELTQSAAFINSSNFWKIVNQRLGTDATRYLLESCAVFMAVPPSCLFQVCGVPFYSCLAMETPSAFHLVNQRSKLLPTLLPYRTGHVSSHTQKGRAVRACDRRRMRRRKRVLWKRKGSKEKEDGENEGEASDIGPVPKRVRNQSTVNGQRAEACWKGTAEQQEVGPCWRGEASNPHTPSHSFICTRGLMYGGRGLKGFLLNRKLKGGAEGSKRLGGPDLMRLIFFDRLPCWSNHDGPPKKLPKRFHGMVDTFNQFLLRHKRFSYMGLLQKACPVAVGRAEDLSSLLALHCSPFRVYCFVRQCLCWVVPEELWGCAHNRVHFLSRVKAFLSMGRFDRLSLSELMWKMKVKECNWLKISKTGRVLASEHRYRERLLGRFLAWLLKGYVVGLVRALFYVTESGGQKNILRFYRSKVWNRLQQLGFSKLLTKGQWEPLTAEQGSALPKTTVVSCLRCIPKQDGLRPIVRVVRMDAQARWFQARVKDLHAVLRVCVEERPSWLGATVFGVQDIHRVLGQFAAAQKDNPQPLYFVKMDVSGAYDSLPHDKLMEVVCEVLSPVLDEVFSVRRYAQVWADSSQTLRKVFRRQAKTLANTELSMKEFVMGLQRERKIHSAILVEQNFSSNICGRDVLEFFKEMLSNYIIQFGKEMFRQCRGIPQGSVVSALLCCLCYGHMENALLRPLVDGGGCLMRLIDDFLLITPDLGKAQTFLTTLQGGVAEYGCFVNPQKVAVNFPLEDGYPDVQVLPSRSLFPWCGLLVDTSTLDVYTDYSSYAGLSLRSSLTLGSTPHAGQQMKRKLLSVLRLKCRAILLDLKMNSQKAVCQNVYKVVLLQAFRFHACAQNLPFGQKVKKNPRFFLLMIWEMAKVTSLLLRQSNHGVHLPVDLCYEAVKLMYCVSFLYVMARHKCLYKRLHSHLQKCKVHLERKLGGLKLALVQRTFMPVIPEDFKLINV
ncbi:telomerase reverse transcriptase [Conger conger]|uniref:telomerase reverse transcriptase n=1 Tax=Conger conger TaxID=82655 RepID=UPI002A5A6885|nr:telomerase reverse transcriptase [Conger conger]